MRLHLILSLFFSITVLAGDLDKAFPAFTSGSIRIVPTDFTKASLQYEINVSASTVKGTATIQFTTREEGAPAFDLVPSPSKVLIDGQSANAPEVSVGGGVTRFRYVDKVVAPGSHTMALSWSVGSANFGNDGVRLGFFMGDLSDRGFFEKYGPTSFEYDQYATTMNVQITGVTKEHVVYTNGRTAFLGQNSWQIEFPDYFTASSYFFHVAPEDYYSESRFQLQLQEKSIPVVIYGYAVPNAESVARSVMKELENDYGSFAHDSLTVYVTSAGGGMEYCGATMTTVGALDHELTHSWFARGVMPADGRSAWFDEAIASWRDSGYPRYQGTPGQQNLGNFSPYRRYTTNLAYSGGMELIGYLDFHLGGMKNVLRQFFAEKKYQTINNEIFRSFMEAKAGKDLKSLFDESVFNDFQVNDIEIADTSHHPRKYTSEELIQLQ